MRRRPWVGLSLMIEQEFEIASEPLFAAGDVDVVEWSFDMGWGRPLTPWLSGILKSYSESNRLLGHGVSYSALDASVNIINATSIARSRGIAVTETASGETENFASMISIKVTTDQGTFEAAGTIFGRQFLRLVKLGPFCFEAFLDGRLLVYRHRDVPGLIGYIGTILGKHSVNIANMALGRQANQPGGDSVAVLNLDSEPSADALAEILAHEEVTGVEVVRLPAAGAGLPWLSGS